MGRCYYHTCKKTADEILHEIIEEKMKWRKRMNYENQSNLDYYFCGSSGCIDQPAIIY